jgi:hypothetical protein
VGSKTPVYRGGDKEAFKKGPTSSGGWVGSKTHSKN